VMFNFAIDRGLAKENPAQGVKKFKDNKRERFLTKGEFERLGEVLTKADDVNPLAIAIIRILMLTGLRKNEVANMQWKDLLEEQSAILIPDSKTGKKFVPLTQPVINIIETLQRVEGNDYLFPGQKNAPYQGFVKVWKSIKLKAKLDDVRLHDLRHSFASVGAMGGESLYIIGKLLGHKDQATTQRYAHIGNNPLVNAAEGIAAEINELISPVDQMKK
jgi:integrase